MILNVEVQLSDRKPDEKVSQPAAKHFNYDLEALRGIAAFIVLWCHSIENKQLLDPHHSVSEQFAFLPPSHLSVLLFFVLSGYVIGLSTKQRLAGPAIGIYLKKRMLRIYPIYLMCMLLTLAVAQSYPWKTVLGNLSLMQVLFTDVITENSASWSLHYEVLYYLLFIPISYLRLPALPVAGAMLLLGGANMMLAPEQPLLSSYCFGFVFWLGGLWLAQHARTAPRAKVSSIALVGGILLLLTLYYFNIFDTSFRKALSLLGNWWQYASTADPFAAQIRFADFAFLPYALVFILVFAGQGFRYRQAVVAFLALCPSLTFVYLFLHAQDDTLGPYLIAAMLYVLAVSFILAGSRYQSGWLEARCTWLLRKFTWVGSISYGLYILHVPVLYLFQRIEVLSGSTGTFILRFVLFLVFTGVGAYWLEKRMQPWIMRKFPVKAK